MADKETKENVLERIRERRAATRRKRMKRLVKVCGALVILALVLAFLYPHLQVMWQIDKARGADAETRKAALQWLADNDVRSATGVFVEALNSSRGESRIAEKALKKFKDPSVVPELLKIWKDTEARTYARYSALQLVAEMGGRELMDTFTDPLAILSDGWESSYDFLNKHAEANTVEKLLTMLESGDERRECASAVALRYLAMGKKAFVRDSEKVRNALAAELLSPKVKVRQEAAYALSYIAGEGQLEQLMAALDDEDRAVCCYAAIAIRCMKPEIAARAVPKLLEKLLDPDGEICTEAARTIAKTGARQALPRLIEIVGDRKVDGFSRERAIEILKTVSDPGAIQAITAALSDPQAGVAKAAAKALIRIGDKSSVAPLVETLKDANSQSLRIVAAYALGMLAAKEAAPALVSALKEGDIELSKVAGAALVRIGARGRAPELAAMIRDPQVPPVARREALLALSKFRTTSSVELAIEQLADESMQIREEASDTVIQLTGDLLSTVKENLEHARTTLAGAAFLMLQKDIGSELRENLLKAESYDRMNSLVLEAMRRLDQANKQDHDDLEVALEAARRMYWRSLLREEFAARKLSAEQLAGAAGELRDYVEKTFMSEEPPMLMHRNIGEELKKKFGFRETGEE